MLLSQILSPEANQRLATLAIVRPEKAAEVGDLLISQYQRGILTEKVSEDKLKSMLNGISAGEAKKATKITFQRKKRPDEDDDDDRPRRRNA